MTLQDLQKRFESLVEPLHIATRREELAHFSVLSQDPNLWSDQEKAVEITAQVEQLKTFLAKWDDVADYLSLAGEEGGDLVLEDISARLQEFEKEALLSGEHDSASAIITIHAGTGGVDAQDWAQMLERMILRYVEQGSTEMASERALNINRQHWKAEVVERIQAEEAGIKKTVIEVKGRYAYGLLQSEAGVHRLVRLSPFNAKSLRQTSFALIEVLPEVEANGPVKIDEKELRIDVFRAGGHGGQGVNTTDSAVRLTHLPTGLTVSVQNERSQHQNKATAMKILLSRLSRLQEVEDAEKSAMLKGEFKEGSWGNQIRSYVLQPYQLVKDHRTDVEDSAVTKVLDGALKPFIEGYLTTKQLSDGQSIL